MLNGGIYNGNRILKAETIENMYWNNLGWYINQISGIHNVVNHSGDLDTFRSAIAFLPEENLTITYITNVNGAVLMDKSIIPDILSIVKGKELTSGMTLKTKYLIFNGIVLLFLSLWTFFAIRLKHWIQKYKLTTYKWTLIRNVINIVGLLTLYFSFPLLVDSPILVQFEFAPDVAIAMLILTVLFVGLSLLKTIFILNRFKRNNVQNKAA